MAPSSLQLFLDEDDPVAAADTFLTYLAYPDTTGDLSAKRRNFSEALARYRIHDFRRSYGLKAARARFGADIGPIESRQFERRLHRGLLSLEQALRVKTVYEEQQLLALKAALDKGALSEEAVTLAFPPIGKAMSKKRYIWRGLRVLSEMGDGSGLRVITMDMAFAQMPDALWLRRVLPNATFAFRSNNRSVQANLCARGAGLAVLPKPLGDATPGIAVLEIDETPPGRDTFVGYHRDLRRLRRMRELLELVIERLAN